MTCPQYREVLRNSRKTNSINCGRSYSVQQPYACKGKVRGTPSRMRVYSDEQGNTCIVVNDSENVLD